MCYIMCCITCCVIFCIMCHVMCHIMCCIMCRVMCRVMCCKSLIFTGGGGRTHNVTQRTDTHIFPRGGRTHNVTQRTDTHIFTRGGTHPQGNPTNGHTYFHRGGRTHNLTQRTDTQIFFDESARIYASCARIFARIFMKIWLVVKHYFINISFKFHKDLSFR